MAAPSRARKGWTASRVRCVNYAIKLLDETLAKVRADLYLSGDDDTLRIAESSWSAARSYLLLAPGWLKAKRVEDEKKRERKRGAGSGWGERGRG